MAGNALVPFKKGHTLSTRIESAEGLVEVYLSYREYCEANEDPQAVPAFLAYASDQLGKAITLTIWADLSKGTTRAAKNVPGLHTAVDIINTGIAGELAKGGLDGRWHPGMAAKMLETLELRAEAKAEREARAIQDESDEVLPDSTESVDRHLAVHVHPDDPDPLAMEPGAVLPRPLFSKAQIEEGYPFIPPPRD